MTLEPGTALGPYEVIGRLGAGGMGEVYRARDTRLGRMVAVKVLPAESVADAHRRERLRREAQAISSLSHPRICGLFDVGEAEGRDFLVMELLEGRTLADRVRKGPLGVKESLQVASEVADALAYAHEHGVVHRDLKPENVILTESGAKLLDFGLAKILEGEGRGGDEGARRTLTQDGFVVGTVDYMSPEQLSGEEVDGRADVFALGCVLYEMLTGTRAFAGASQASVIGAILHVPPPEPSTLRAAVPPLLDRIAMKCLAKRPADRWQTARDLADELSWARSVIGSGGLDVRASDPARRPIARRAAPAFVAAAIVLAALAGAFLARRPGRERPAPPPVRRLSRVLPAPITLAGGFGNPIALSRDGGLLAFVGTAEAGRSLYLWPEDREEPIRLPDTDDADAPFLSPDSQWVGFFAGGKLLKAPVSGGGKPVALADAALGAGAVWLPDDTIVYSAGYDSPLLRLPAAGGRTVALTALDTEHGERTHRFPDLLPGGEELAFVVGDSTISTFDDARLEAVSLKSGRRRLLLKGASYARVLPDAGGRPALVVSRNQELWAVALDRASLTPVSVPVSLAEPVRVTTSGAAAFALSAGGDLVALSSQSEEERRLAWIDRYGRMEPALDAPRYFLLPKLSPDGTRVAAVVYDRTYDVWSADLAKGTLSRVTFGSAQSSRPVFTPDGKSLVFASWRPGLPAALYETPLDAGQPARKLLPAEPNDQRPDAISPDGRHLVLNEYTPQGRSDLRVAALTPPFGVEELLRTPSIERDADFSPDGRFIAYVSNESGREEVYVRPFRGPVGRTLVSRGGGGWPVFARKGGELFYRLGRKVYSVAYDTTSGFVARAPQLLFEAPTVDTRFDVDPSGSRFLMVALGPREGLRTELRVVQGFAGQVARRLAPPAAGP